MRDEPNPSWLVIVLLLAVAFYALHLSDRLDHIQRGNVAHCIR